MPHEHRAGCGCAVSRRRLIGGAAALTAVLASGRGGLAQTAPPAKARLIDAHHHYNPPEIVRAWQEYRRRLGEEPLGPRAAQWTVGATLEEMDKNGVATAIVSLASIPGVWFGFEPQKRRDIVRLGNDYGAGIVRDHPGRFGLFASLPMPDVEASLKEIEYAFDTLKADGIVLATSFGDRWPGDPAYRPVFEELNRRKALVFFHPYAPNCCETLKTGIPSGVLENPYDTGRAITSLLYSGSLARLREVRWLFSHGGGVMPMLAGRVESFARGLKNLKEIAPDGVLAELRRLHYDTANAAWPISLAALLKMVPVSQVLFGSDYPYVLTAPQLAALADDGVPAEALAAIQRGNAVRLIRRLEHV